MEGRRGLIGSVDDSIEVMGSTSWWQRKWRDLQDDGNEGDGMIALLKIRKDEIRKNEGGDELFIGRKSTENEATLLFRNEANQPMPHVQAFNENCSRSH